MTYYWVKRRKYRNSGLEADDSMLERQQGSQDYFKITLVNKVHIFSIQIAFRAVHCTPWGSRSLTEEKTIVCILLGTRSPKNADLSWYTSDGLTQVKVDVWGGRYVECAVWRALVFHPWRRIIEIEYYEVPINKKTRNQFPFQEDGRGCGQVLIGI